jgi:GxxExxY protein
VDRLMVGALEELNHEAHQAHEGPAKDLEGIARTLVDAGLTVHRALGPGLLESAYEHCLAYELHKRGLELQRQVVLPIIYDGAMIDAGHRLDLLVEDAIVVEVKSIDALTRVHEAQILTYLKLSGRRIGF